MSQPQLDDEREWPIAKRLAQRIAAFDAQDLTPRALAAARTAIIDTIGVTLAGSAEPCVRILLDTPGIADAPGKCTVLGTNVRTSALDAALLNGTASHALDYDDFSQPMGGHQSVPLVAPLLALAEERKLSGNALIAAYVIGIETEIRLARAVNFHHYDKGWHPTATLGIFGTVAATSHLLKLDSEQIATALAIAASLAAGLKANFGTMVKPLHVGHIGRSGLFAVLIAERGFTANAAAIEHRQGFFNAFNGPGHYDAQRIFENWGTPLEVESETLGLKQFPCCGSTHPAIAMALALVHEEHVKPEQIESIHIQAHRRRLPHTDNPDPRTPLGAKFSVQYAVARALVDGVVRLENFEGDAHLDPRVRRLLAITRTDPHPDMPEDAEHQFGAEVTLTLRDGRVLSRRIDNLIGRGPANPMSTDELWEKFADCSKRAIGSSEALALYERLEALEEVSDVSTLARLLAKRVLPGGDVAKQKLEVSSAPERKSEETAWVP
ncbi:putative MmgE/Prp family protein [Paraburkholderia piptadeniae]|uniref:MmgE/Prp family protein n=1 Tax=Paraburkholderia piptadeniae TaxID=1701573 RepID=A0A1N7SDR3_9BURK|nr:MmgE/PrpD family protein [Paraburkholderia piptadeniae]SIT45503.1 putative MmgE/Prp family protein [Paraburkholderia piptadeniae]